MPANQSDWDRSGGFRCPKCGQETVRLKEITPGVYGCPECYRDYAKYFVKTEASLAPLLDSGSGRLARMARRQLLRKAPL